MSSPSLEEAHGVLGTDVATILQNLSPAVIHRFAGKRVLITGGRGFLGRYFGAVFDAMNRSILKDAPVQVSVLDNLVSAGPVGSYIPSLQHFEFVNHNIIHSYHVDASHKPDFVLACAGIASPQHYRRLPLETLDVAVNGLRNTLGLARTHGARMVFFSSSEIYGDPDESNVPTSEAYRGNVSCLGPRAVYDESKRLGETLCAVYAEKFATQVCIVRPFNVYGPGMQRGDYRVLPNFAAAVVDGKPLTVYGDGRQTRTYCYVTDAINGFLRALVYGRPGQAYNIGNPSPEVAVNTLAGRVQGVVTGLDPSRTVTVNVLPHPPEYPADEPNRRCPNIAKASTELSYEPTMSLDKGLERFFVWALRTYEKQA